MDFDLGITCIYTFLLTHGNGLTGSSVKVIANSPQGKKYISQWNYIIIIYTYEMFVCLFVFPAQKESKAQTWLKAPKLGQMPQNWAEGPQNGQRPKKRSQRPQKQGQRPKNKEESHEKGGQRPPHRLSIKWVGTLNSFLKICKYI